MKYLELDDEFYSELQRTRKACIRVAAWDADGNLLNAPAALLGETTRNVALSYDARNRLKSADGLSYRYDFEGHRNQVIGAEATTWVNDPVSSSLSRMLSKTVNGQTTYYIWGNGLAYQINPNGTTSTYHFDQVGSTVAISADDGIAVTDRFEYSPYGLRTHREGTSDIVFQYNGKFGVQTDANGLLYMRARYYHPVLRRFLNQDPIGFEGGLNWFAYADGNPVTKNDPRGEFAWVIGGAIIGGGLDYAAQVASNYASGQTGGKAWTNVSMTSIAVSAGAGALTGGIGSVVSKVGTVTTRAVINGAVNSAASAGGQVAKNYLGVNGEAARTNLGSGVASATAWGALTGAGGSLAGDGIEAIGSRAAAAYRAGAWNNASLASKQLISSGAITTNTSSTGWVRPTAVAVGGGVSNSIGSWPLNPLNSGLGSSQNTNMKRIK